MYDTYDSIEIRMNYGLLAHGLMSHNIDTVLIFHSHAYMGKNGRKNAFTGTRKTSQSHLNFSPNAGKEEENVPEGSYQT